MSPPSPPRTSQALNKKHRECESPEGDEVFALTPQTEEKYKKIDEEFDKMMQSYRLAVSSWWSAASPPPPQFPGRLRVTGVFAWLCFGAVLCRGSRCTRAPNAPERAGNWGEKGEKVAPRGGGTGDPRGPSGFPAGGVGTAPGWAAGGASAPWPPNTSIIFPPKRGFPWLLPPEIPTSRQGADGVSPVWAIPP